MKLTLLQVVNTYLDYTDGFIVSTLDGSVEAQQVVTVAQKVFHDLVTDVFANTQLETLIQLDSLADSTKPNYLKLPDDMMAIRDSKVLYDVADLTTEIVMAEMIYLLPSEFLQQVGQTKLDDNSQVVEDFGGYKMHIRNNAPPEFYTSFDDSHLVFDSYDSVRESTLQKNKNGVITIQQRTFTKSETYIIDLPEWFHPTYLNAVMAEASEALREEPLPTIAKKAQAGIKKARDKQRIGKRHRRKDYGRHNEKRTSRRTNI